MPTPPDNTPPDNTPPDKPRPDATHPAQRPTDTAPADSRGAQGDHAVAQGGPVTAAVGAAVAVASAPVRLAKRARPLLGAMRIRKKLVILHTVFSLAMGAALLLSLRPAVRAVVREAEENEATLSMALLASDPKHASTEALEGVDFLMGDSAIEGVEGAAVRAARSAPGRDFPVITPDGAPRLIRFDEARGEFLSVTARLPAARAAVMRVYILLTAALLGVYLLIALTLETFVLPRQVYGPIGRMLDADAAVQAGDREHELIPESRIPQDELGEIMRSRNESVTKLRRQETALNHALDQLEIVAMELKRKNHLLETARRNLADQDRLASLGMMSAGIAHELNTPLAVLKGQVERICESPGETVREEHAALMLRVVQRLERLSESLLDFARVRPPAVEPCVVRTLVDEAWTLVRLDRDAGGVRLVNLAPGSCIAQGDSTRLSQVFVNLLRNAVDALADTGGVGTITVEAADSLREGRRWISVTIADDGPGIDPKALPTLFEPFTSTRLDSRGTGLGLAVSEGIIREHGGVILARNGAPSAGGGSGGLGSARVGAVFEIMLPAASGSAGDAGNAHGAPPDATEHAA